MYHGITCHDTRGFYPGKLSQLSILVEMEAYQGVGRANSLFDVEGVGLGIHCVGHTYCGGVLLVDRGLIVCCPWPLSAAVLLLHGDKRSIVPGGPLLIYGCYAILIPLTIE